MPLLQVRGCPEDVYKKVSLVARQQNRTIAQQVVVLLEKGLCQEQSNLARRSQLIKSIAKRPAPDKAKRLDAVALIREDRGR